MKIITVSDIGNAREINQDYVDYYIKDHSHAIAVLCDGMGGHLAGEVASKKTTQLIIDQYKEIDLEEEFIEPWLLKVIFDADDQVTMDAKTNEEHEGMGTTVVIALLSNHALHISNVGDSRGYFFKEGKLTQLTVDHTLVQALVQNGTISKEEAAIHPQRNILLQAIGGGNELKIPYNKFSVHDELILLCSDGLYNSLSNEQMEQVLCKQTTLKEKGQELVDKANMFGGHDNISVILIQVGDDNDE